MDSINRLRAVKTQLTQKFESECAHALSQLTAGKRTKAKRAIRNKPEYQRLRFYKSPIEDVQKQAVQGLFQGLRIPDRWWDLLHVSNGFYLVDDIDESPQGFASSSLELNGSQAYLSSYQYQLNQILYEERFPIEFRRILFVGKLGRSDIGLWLQPEQHVEAFVVLFKSKPPRGYLFQHEFQIIAESVDDFLTHLADTVEQNKPWSLLFDENKVCYSFLEPELWPDYWRSLDPEQERTLLTLKTQ